MFVKSRMTTKVISLSPDQSVPDAQGLFKLHNLKHLPVVENGRVIGVVSRVEVAKASPSTASTLDARELTYLLSKVKVRDIMIKNLYTVSPDMLLEEAATIMRSHRVSFLPVVEDGDRLVGVITESNVLDAFIDILGFTDRGTRLTIEVKDTGHGILSVVAGVFATCGTTIRSIALYRLPDDHAAMVFGTELEDTTELEMALAAAGYPVTYKLKNA